MPISEWFKARESRRYTSSDPAARRPMADGAWEKCPDCKHILYAGDLDRTHSVCPHCGHHFEVEAPERVVMLADEDAYFDEIAEGLRSGDPLGFTSGKPYAESYAAAVDRTGLNEAVIVGRTTIGGHPVVLGVMDFRFIGASMGSVVGEKITRAFEAAVGDGRAVVLVTASGGARMQEGMLSLMQMAKTSAAAERLSRAGLPYVAVLANPTYGGVTASFATLADITIAEPGAMVGFAGPRLVEQTIKQSLPKGFQTAESLVGHGMIDAVVPRSEVRDTVATVLGHLMPKGGAS